MTNKIKKTASVLQSLVLQIEFSFVCRFVLRYIFRVKFNQTQNLSTKKQFIIIANHSSHLDTVCLLAALPRKKIVYVKPVAAADYFGKNKLRAKLSNYFVNTLLISRKLSFNMKEQSVDKVLEAIDAGYSLIIYPEGTRNKKDGIQELKKGISYILEDRPHIYYIPAYIKGMRQLFSFKNIVVSSRSSATFGVPSTKGNLSKNELMVQIREQMLQLGGFRQNEQID